MRETAADLERVQKILVAADGRPIVGPVDGIFLRGRFHSAPPRTPSAPATSAPGHTSAPRDGAEAAEEFIDSGPVYWRIEPERMFSFHLPS